MPTMEFEGKAFVYSHHLSVPYRELIRCVPPALDDEVQDLSFIVDGAPQIRPPSADPAVHLVQMPARRGGPRRFSQPLGEDRPELDGPAPDRLVADIDPALRQQILDVSKTEAELKVQ